MKFPVPNGYWAEPGRSRVCAACSVVGECMTPCKCESGWAADQARALRVQREQAEHRAAFVHVKPVSSKAAAAREALEKRMVERVMRDVDEREKRMGMKFKAVRATAENRGEAYNGYSNPACEGLALALAAQYTRAGGAPFPKGQFGSVSGWNIVEDKEPAAEYILWSPGSDLPPKVRYKSEAQAKGVAEAMAKKNPGQEFVVCELKGSCVVPPAAPVWREPAAKERA